MRGGRHAPPPPALSRTACSPPACSLACPHRILAPFLQTYTLSGGFTFWQRCWDSLKENLILYAVLGVVGAGALIYIGVAYQMDMCVRRACRADAHNTR